MLRLCLKKMTVIGCPTHEAFPGCVMTTGGNFLYVQYMFLPFKIKERSSPGFHSRSSLGSITQITNSCINSLLRFPCHEYWKNPKLTFSFISVCQIQVIHDLIRTFLALFYDNHIQNGHCSMAYCACFYYATFSCKNVWL